MEEDPELEIIKARKMKEMLKAKKISEKKKIITDQKEKNEKKEINDHDFLLPWLYDRGDEVLSLAESQYPLQSKIIIHRIVDLIKSGDLDQKISGGELLSIFRTVGLNIRINTTVKIEDHGKFLSFSEKLRQEKLDEE
ncbi:MAG: double-stranded DNA-binding protein [Nitrososphaeraceae archaeon]|nr:double-stranded DNA-binding protein [Nitrososphaeraceae archaeon]